MHPILLSSRHEDTKTSLVHLTTALQTLNYFRFFGGSLNARLEGIMDNFVMITAGDLIDNTLGVKFGMATLTAAACGQVVSDVCGVCFGGTVEAFATKFGLPSPDLTSSQRRMKVSRLTATFGAVIGVVIGCFLGMGTLFLVDTTAADREKKQVSRRGGRETSHSITIRRPHFPHESILCMVRRSGGERYFSVGPSVGPTALNVVLSPSETDRVALVIFC